MTAVRPAPIRARSAVSTPSSRFCAPPLTTSASKAIPTAFPSTPANSRRTGGSQPGRLAAAGYAEYHPGAGNDTAEGRGQNRRVDIIVLPYINGVPQTEQAAPARPASATQGDSAGHHDPAAKGAVPPTAAAPVAALH